MMTRIALVLMAIVGQIPVASVRGDDWPQILGPNRNGIAQDQQLAEKWAGGKPKKVWESPIGSGFAGVAVANNQVVLFHREKSNDQLSSFAADSGKPLWTTSFPSNFQPQIVEDDGPRAVPTIDQGNVYAYSATGKLYCVDLKTGENAGNGPPMKTLVPMGDTLVPVHRRWLTKNRSLSSSAGIKKGLESSPLTAIRAKPSGPP